VSAKIKELAMKKLVKAKKLSLAKETVRSLASSDLAHVAGALMMSPSCSRQCGPISERNCCTATPGGCP
jgi:hypothetical protein